MSTLFAEYTVNEHPLNKRPNESGSRFELKSELTIRSLPDPNAHMKNIRTVLILLKQ